MHKFLGELNKMRNAKDTYYKNIWVVQYQENIKERAYLHWSCKNIKDQTDAVVNTQDVFNRHAYVYEAMVAVG